MPAKVFVGILYLLFSIVMLAVPAGVILAIISGEWCWLLVAIPGPLFLYHLLHY